MRRFCMACDLKDDPALIEEYKAHHEEGKAWPAITKSIKDAGVMDMQIFLTGNRLFMIMEVDDTFSFEEKSKMDAENSEVQKWEDLMWDYQQELPWAPKGEKWILMDQIFKL
ncbi:MAG: L-rhamnose mutarotase [Cyclobacteriaceae bacterium]